MVIDTRHKYKCNIRCELFNNYESYCGYRIPSIESKNKWRYRLIILDEIGKVSSINYGYCTKESIVIKGEGILL